MILGYVGEKEEFITNINDEIVKEITDFMITLPNLTKDILVIPSASSDKTTL